MLGVTNGMRSQPTDIHPSIHTCFTCWLVLQPQLNHVIALIERCRAREAVLASTDSRTSHLAQQHTLADCPLGFTLDDADVTAAAKVLRLLYIEDLRQLQNSVDRLVVNVQVGVAYPFAYVKCIARLAMLIETLSSFGFGALPRSILPTRKSTVGWVKWAGDSDEPKWSTGTDDEGTAATHPVRAQFPQQYPCKSEEKSVAITTESSKILVAHFQYTYPMMPVTIELRIYHLHKVLVRFKSIESLAPTKRHSHQQRTNK